MRLRKGECEVCGRAADVSVHQIGKLADLGKPGPGQPEWARLMAKRRRKTLVACAECHHAMHAEHIAALFTAWSPESPWRGNSHGGFGRGLSGKRAVKGTSPGSLPLPRKPVAAPRRTGRCAGGSARYGESWIA
jgi:hypothetical protein